MRLSRVLADHGEVEIPVPEDDVAAGILGTGCDEEACRPAPVAAGPGVGKLALDDQGTLDRVLAERQPCQGTQMVAKSVS